MSGGWNLLAFREGRRSVSGHVLLCALEEQIARAAALPGDQDALTGALLRAGEVECALTDAGSPSQAAAARITDQLAAALVRRDPLDLRAVLLEAESIHPPNALPVSPPEGFAYYMLHPLDYADVVARLTLTRRDAVVAGIRSIGSTLSAVVCAALRSRGVHSRRLTVRPEGHPFDRQARLSPSQLQLVERGCANGAEFFVADEGPGLSGSSFVSVGEALAAAGAPRSQIRFLASRKADPKRFQSGAAAVAWNNFQSCEVAPPSRFPEDAGENYSGDAWRRDQFGDLQDWPAAWPAMERLKRLSSDGRSIYKFEGFGHYGAAVLQRAKAVAESGFGPGAESAGHGFVRYERVPGKPVRRPETTTSVIHRLAAYCAFRATHAAFMAAHASTEQLRAAVSHNLREEFGWELDVPLPVERAVIADARMMPHEWIASPAGTLIKTDAASHGDDHFFPGPTDSAWDVAGAMVEWELRGSAAESFLRAYTNRSFDRVESRLHAYLLAYAVTRMAFCKMAAQAVAGTADELRMMQQYARYRTAVEELAPARAQSVSG